MDSGEFREERRSCTECHGGNRSVCLLPGPTYFPGPNCLVLETGYVFLLHLSYTHRHFPNKLLCLHLLTGCFPNKNPCPHLPTEAD